jgi:hypothetical protein
MCTVLFRINKKLLTFIISEFLSADKFNVNNRRITSKDNFKWSNSTGYTVKTADLRKRTGTFYGDPCDKIKKV